MTQRIKECDGSNTLLLIRFLLGLFLFLYWLVIGGDSSVYNWLFNEGVMIKEKEVYLWVTTISLLLKVRKGLDHSTSFLAKRAQFQLFCLLAGWRLDFSNGLSICTEYVISWSKKLYCFKENKNTQSRTLKQKNKKTKNTRNPYSGLKSCQSIFIYMGC